MDESKDIKIYNGRLIAAGRTLANLKASELAELASVTARTIHRIETSAAVPVTPKLRHGHVSRDVWDRIVSALEQHGVEVIAATSEHGAGVRLKRF